MCLLTFLPAGAQPDTAALANGAVLNDDGHGFAITAGDRIIVRRSLHADELIDAFAALRSRHPDGPALFHSRLGTAGANDLANCHPFTVGGDGRTVLAHNGVLPDAVQPVHGDPRCDTRIVADDLIPALGSLRARRTRLRLQRWIGAGNKIVILSVDRRFRQPAYILNEDAGMWDGGIWYSNSGYQPYPPPRPRSWWPATGRLLTCADCGAIADPDDGNCRWCDTCLDCGDPAGYCQCYRTVAQPPSRR